MGNAAVRPLEDEPLTSPEVIVEPRNNAKAPNPKVEDQTNATKSPGTKVEQVQKPPETTAANNPPPPAAASSETSIELRGVPLVSSSKLVVQDEPVGPLQPKVLHETDKDEDWATFRLGLFVGINIIVFIENMRSVVSRVDNKTIDWSIMTRLYRGSFLVSVFLFFLAINVHYWKRTGVNYVRIFEFKREECFKTSDYLELAAFITAVWAISLLAFLEYKRLHIPVFASPLALLCFYVIFIFNPVHYFWYKGRIWFLKHMYRFLTSPFHKVGFADFWMADTMSAFTSVLLDFQYSICIYTYKKTLFLKIAASGPPGKKCLEFCSCNSPLSYVRPFIRFLPPLIRIIQCLRRYRDSKKKPHLYNTLKYIVGSCTILLTSLTAYYEYWFPKRPRIENPFLYLWLLVSTIASCYSFYWDVKMDWGLFDPEPGHNRFLREDLVYHPRCLYYFAIVEDFFLRCAWPISFIITENEYTNSDIMITIFAPLELFRFFVWNFLRLENEHLNNCVIQFQEFADVANFRTRRRQAIYDDREPVVVIPKRSQSGTPAGGVPDPEPEDDHSVGKYLTAQMVIIKSNLENPPPPP